jgi:hypothetical protein
MTRHTSIDKIEGIYSLTFHCGELAADSAIRAAGHEPNGYFWEGVAAFVAEKQVSRLELDSEAGMFSVDGARWRLKRLQRHLEPLLDDPDAVAELIRQAEGQGFEFND